MFDQNLIANVLSITLFVVSLLIAIRAFFLYVRARSRRLFVLFLSMSVISLTAAAGFAGDNVTSINLNVDWFNYIGQTVSFLFILLSCMRNSDNYLQQLTRWQVIVTVLLLILLFLAPILPAEFPDPALTKTILSGSRGLICLFIFFYYVTAFMTKESRFSLFMGIAFLLLGVGYLIIIPKYSVTALINPDILDHIGDMTRVGGLIMLSFAVLLS